MALMLVHPDTCGAVASRVAPPPVGSRLEMLRPGRATVDLEIRTLVSEMAAANPLWGAPRMHGELCKLGLDISERTVSRLWPIDVGRRHKRGGLSWPIT
jgi:hypothetical protein